MKPYLVSLQTGVTVSRQRFNRERVIVLNPITSKREEIMVEPWNVYGSLLEYLQAVERGEAS